MQWDPPHEDTEISMWTYPNGEYDLYVPESHVPVGEELTLEVYADEKDWDCEFVYAEYGPYSAHDWVCDESKHSVDLVQFYIDGVNEKNSSPDSNADYSHEYIWPVSGLPLGTHTVRIVAIGRNGDQAERTVTVNIKRGEQILDLERSVTWRDNYFSVELKITNIGTLDVALDTVVENMTGFIPWHLDGALYSGTPTYTEATAQASVEFDLSGPHQDFYLLRPEQSVNIHYRAAPILLPTTNINHVFGDLPVEFEDHSGDYEADISRPTVTTRDDSSLEDAVDAAQADADYMLVTAPERLYTLHNDSAVTSVLQSMAELAAYRLGVLAFLPSPLPDAEDVRTLIHAWGAPMRGSDGTEGGYHANGYLVLVGEDEIIPSWDPDFEIISYDNIERSDLQYANTAGSWLNPELIVSRIIGNSPADLEASIRTSLAVKAGTSGPGFARNKALVVAGDGDGWRAFHRNVDDVQEILDDEFPTVDKGKVRNLGDPMTWFNTNVTDQNVIFFRDHCGGRGWGDTDVVRESSFPLNFGTASPFVFACCCTAGRYEEVGNGGIAETFTQNGAAVYIGSTEISPRYHNNYYCRDYFKRWVGHSDTFGQVFRQEKRDMDGYVDDYWAIEYQMYGDPKLGGSSIVAEAFPSEPAFDRWNSFTSSFSDPLQKRKRYTDSFVGSYRTVAYKTQIKPKATENTVVPVESPSVLPASPLSKIQVTVPDYKIVHYDGYDHLEIAGAMLFQEPNRPAVPRYSSQQTLPAGYRVQEVTLLSRSAAKIVDGLQLFHGIQEPDGSFGASKGTNNPGWWPVKPFRWEVEPNPDGTGTLSIHVYPFTYNSATAQGRFYKEHLFQVRYTVSKVEISLDEQGPLEFGPGEEQIGVLWIKNAGEPVDAVVSAIIRPVGPIGEYKGLPLRTLEKLQGLASFPLRWDTSGSPIGEYIIEVELRDLNGDLLDSAVATFRLGTVTAKATGLTLTPEFFQPGETLEISHDFHNAGSVPVSGTATIQIMSHETGEIISKFEEKVGLLAPGVTKKVSMKWESPKTACGTYDVTAYVLYSGRSTAVLKTTAMAGEKRQCPPESSRK